MLDHSEGYGAVDMNNVNAPTARYVKEGQRTAMPETD
jgi:hypothetical protein